MIINVQKDIKIVQNLFKFQTKNCLKHEMYVFLHTLLVIILSVKSDEIFEKFRHF